MPFLVATMLLAADLFGAVRTEGWAGTAPNDPRTSSGSILLDGFVGLRVKSDEFTLNTTYNPRFVETPPPQGSGLAAVHGVLASVDYQYSRTGHVLLQELGSFGRNDFSLLVASARLDATAPRLLDPRLPTKALLAIVDSDTTLAFEQDLSRRLRVNATAGFMLYGGADALAQRYLPLQRGPHGSARIGWLLVASDRLSLSASGSQTRFPDGSRATLASLVAGWNHQFNVNTSAELGVGSAFDESSGPNAGRAGTPFPSVSGALTHTLPLRHGGLSGRLAASATPQVDRTTGDIYELASAALELNWILDRDIRFSAISHFGRALSGSRQTGTQLVTAEASASYRTGDLATFDAGARSVWQSVPPTVPGVLALPGFQWAAFAGVSFALRGQL